MKITIEFIDHPDQRYSTPGDWFFTPSQDMLLRISKMPDRRHMYLIAIHELVEAFLCQEDGVTQLAVDKFDIQWRPHSDDGVEYSEPGEDPRAPYHEQHVMAEIVERIVAQAMCVHWQTYEAAIARLLRAGDQDISSLR